MHVLSAQPSTSTDTIRIIWSELVHTLRSQWDASQGDSSRGDLTFFVLGDVLLSFSTWIGAPWYGIMLYHSGFFFMPPISHLD